MRPNCGINDLDNLQTPEEYPGDVADALAHLQPQIELDENGGSYATIEQSTLY